MRAAVVRVPDRVATATPVVPSNVFTREIVFFFPGPMQIARTTVWYPPESISGFATILFSLSIPDTGTGPSRFLNVTCEKNGIIGLIGSMGAVVSFFPGETFKLLTNNTTTFSPGEYLLLSVGVSGGFVGYDLTVIMRPK